MPALTEVDGVSHVRPTHTRGDSKQTMRIAVVSDIHGSLAAFEAVRADIDRAAPDVVVHGGDLAVNGARGDEVVTAIRELGWQGVLGNTDEMLWRLDDMEHQLASMPRFESVLKAEYRRTAPATLETLGLANLEWLKSLPTTLSIGEITLVHATPTNLWRAPMPDSDDAEFTDGYGDLPGSVVVYGHIHRPLVRALGTRVVANSGSAGMSWDGDRRASYVLVDGRDVEVRRIEFDLEADVRDLFDRDYPMAQWLAEMRLSASYIFPDI